MKNPFYEVATFVELHLGLGTFRIVGFLEQGPLREVQQGGQKWFPLKRAAFLDLLKEIS